MIFKTLYIKRRIQYHMHSSFSTLVRRFLDNLLYPQDAGIPLYEAAMHYLDTCGIFTAFRMFDIDLIQNKKFVHSTLHNFLDRELFEYIDDVRMQHNYDECIDSIDPEKACLDFCDWLFELLNKYRDSHNKFTISVREFRDQYNRILNICSTEIES